MPELWLPGNEEFVFKAEYVDGKEIWIGWATSVLKQLRMLNDRTLRDLSEQLERWKLAGAEKEAPFEVSARFGMSVMMNLAEQAVMHNLPRKLDY